MTAVMYSAGLHIGEVCQLRYEDIDRKNMRVHICHSKNRRERYAIFSKTALDLFTRYWFTYDKLFGWLFPKQFNADRPIDIFYLSQHIHAHERGLGWGKCLTCHTVPHAFGIHLYENGTDLLTIRSLLGHKSLESITIYAHLSRNAPAMQSALLTGWEVSLV